MAIKAYYAAPIAEFLATDDDTVLGKLAGNNQHSLEDMQRLAWREQITRGHASERVLVAEQGSQRTVIEFLKLRLRRGWVVCRLLSADWFLLR